MLASLAFLTSVSLSLVSVIYIFYIIVRNYCAHGFFEKLASGLPEAPGKSIVHGHSWKLHTHPRNYLNTYKLHQRLGPTFCAYMANKPVVMTTDLDLIKTVNLDELNDHLERPFADSLLEELQSDSPAFAPVHQWMRLRKAIAPAFSSHRVKSINVRTEVQLIIDKLVASIERKLEQAEAMKRSTLELNAEDMFHRYTLALVFGCFYKRFNEIDFDSKIDWWQKTVTDALGLVSTPLFQVLNSFPLFLYPIGLILNYTPLGSARKQICGFIRKQTDLNLRDKQTSRSDRQTGDEAQLLAPKESFKRNLMDYVIDQFLEGKLKAKEYLHTSLFIFHASHKSSADLLTRLIYLLAHNQEKQDKLRNSVVADGENSEYLEWSINEALRLYPPSPIGSTRVVSRDLKTQHGLVPKGCIVSTSTFAIHRLTEFWGEDVEEFRPERWKDSRNFHPCQFIPFGVGRRSCIGGMFASQQSKMLMNNLIRRYRFLSSPETVGFLKFSAPMLIFTVADEPTFVRVTRIEKEQTSI